MKDGGRNIRNEGIWMDSGRERHIINKTWKVEKQRRNRGRWTWGKEDECSEKELGERLGRGVKEE